MEEGKFYLDECLLFIVINKDKKYNRLVLMGDNNKYIFDAYTQDDDEFFGALIENKEYTHFKDIDEANTFLIDYLVSLLSGTDMHSLLLNALSTNIRALFTYLFDIVVDETCYECSYYLSELIDTVDLPKLVYATGESYKGNRLKLLC